MPPKPDEHETFPYSPIDSLEWYRGKNLKDWIEYHVRGKVNIPHLAVVMILAARDQGLTLEEIVQELIAANEFKTLPDKLDKDQTIRDLGF
jgi:hypothetical protein